MANEGRLKDTTIYSRCDRQDSPEFHQNIGRVRVTPINCGFNLASSAAIASTIGNFPLIRPFIRASKAKAIDPRKEIVKYEAND
jgi:hypothetical protein